MKNEKKYQKHIGEKYNIDNLFANKKNYEFKKKLN